MNSKGLSRESTDIQTRKGFLGGLSGTLVSSICCIIPLILLIIGVGVTAGLAISQYRPYFILAGTVFIGAYIFLHIRQKAVRCSCGYKEMIKREEKFISATLLTFITGLLIINFLVIPFITGIVVTRESFSIADGVYQNSTSENLRAVRLSIDGMSCESCAGIIKDKLMKEDGIIRVDISYKEKGGIVIFDPAYTSVDRIVEAIKPYRATVISEWEVTP
jgi:copper chaperone CopZ